MCGEDTYSTRGSIAKTHTNALDKCSTTRASCPQCRSTDYLIAQNLKNAYQTWEAENAPEVGRVTSPAPAAGARAPRTAADGVVPDAGQRPYWESPDDGRRPYWEEDSDDSSRAEPKNSNTNGPRSGSQGRPTPEASPPPIPADIKAGINVQIKQQLVERQAHATASDTDALPNSLRPGHTLFRVNAPLDVPSEAPGRYCSLGASDYIERTGEMDENGTVPVQVKLSSISDCHSGLATRVSVNDLEAMDNEQREALTNALLAASKSMGANGLPQGPATAPLLVAAGPATGAGNGAPAGRCRANSSGAGCDDDVEPAAVTAGRSEPQARVP
jgi:hypothetical protein